MRRVVWAAAVLFLVVVLVPVPAGGQGGGGPGPSPAPEPCHTAGTGVPPATPSGIEVSPGPGPDRITVAWDPVEGATGYHVWAYNLSAPIACVQGSEPGPDGRFHFVDLLPSGGSPVEGISFGRTRTYNVSAVNDDGESPRSAGVSSTTFLTCTGPMPVCVGLHPVTLLHVATAPVALSGAPIAAVPIDVGRLRVDAASTYMEQTFVFPGSADLSVLEQDIGVVQTSYERWSSGLEVVLGPPESEGPAPVVAGVWASRLWIYMGPDKVTDAPLIALFPFGAGPVPEEDGCADCNNAPGPGSLAVALVAIAAAALAGFARRRHHG